MQDACSTVLERFKPAAMYTSGLLFGVGWWVWGDSIAVAAVHGAAFDPLHLIPGLVATLAVLVMSCSPRSELNDSVYGDDASVCRTRLTLLVSYIFAVVAIVASVVLLLRVNAGGDPALDPTQQWVGAAGIIQSCLVVGSGIVGWYFKAGGEDAGYSYGY
ncbi:hypothetical protein V8C86DRAFT_2552659 [Haematococcus lacustris]